MRTPLAALLLLASWACTARPAEPPPPALAPTPTASPRALSPLAAAPPLGLLTERTRSLWNGSQVPFRAAVLFLLTEDSNPLSLSDEESRELVRLLDRRTEAMDRWSFRMSRLYEVCGGRNWQPARELPGNEVFQAPEELLASRIDEVRPGLEQASGGKTVEAVPYPEALEDQPATSDYETSPAPWEETVPPEDRLEPWSLALILPGVVAPLEGEQAARAMAELAAMLPPLKDSAEGWEGLLDVATANPERLGRVTARAVELSQGTTDWVEATRQAGLWLEKQGP